MMHNWHPPHCRRSDVVIYDGLGIPVCMDCGEVAQPFDVGKDQRNELDIPQGPKRSSMQLTWPPSVDYTGQPYIFNKDKSLVKALELHLDQPCYPHGSINATTHSSSSIDEWPSQTSFDNQPAYKQLQGTKIRVLKLSKGRFADPLHGYLETIDLHSEEPKTDEPSILLPDDDRNRTLYEALSYTWATISGNRQKDHTIFIGKSWNMLPITENCFDALKNCRLEDEDRYLWIDSICINQSDISERTHQVGLMKDIYSAASRVLIYLSVDHAGGNSTAFIDDPEILCHNPYFSRIWVVQEIASAKKAIVLYKQKSMGWDFFHANLQRLMTRKWVRHFGRAKQLDDAESFLALLEDTWDCIATDPRDKVFALLGLWKASPEPDYTLSPQVVYTGLASRFVTDKLTKLAGRVLDMASQGHSMTGLPSWVPDWSVKSQQLNRRAWTKTSFLPNVITSSGPSKKQRFRVHRGTGSLCVVAAEIDVLAPYLYNGFRVTADGMTTATVGQVQVSLPLHVASRCEPTDRIFEVHEYEFFLILRKKADTHIYTFIGLCDYQLSATAWAPKVDAIRYLSDWAWLLGGQRTWTWSKLANWEATHKCWLTLKEQRRLERRIYLRRIICKAHFLKQIGDLTEATRQLFNNYHCEPDRLSRFFSRRYTTIYQQWRVADDLQTSLQQAYRSKIQDTFRGYKSLAPSPESLETIQLDPSMWLPISSHWFHWTEHYGKDQLYSYYSPLAACIAKHIPLPPLNLVDTPENRLSTFLDADLETGLRQLQFVAHNYPLRTPENIQKSRSYPLNTPHGHSFKTEYLDAFLRWISKPWSPSVEALGSNFNLNSLLVWEAMFNEWDGIHTNISVIHKKLDKNFDEHIASSSTSSGSDTAFTRFFNLIYREQFELLWLFVFHNSDSLNKAVEKFPLFNIGAEFARVFWWRFYRSIDKVYQTLGKELPTDDEIERQWGECLNWLAQKKSQSVVTNLNLPYLELRRRLVYSEDELNDRWQSDFFGKLNRYGSFVSTRPDNTRNDAYSEIEESFTEEQLSQIVHSEIERRRLAETVFAFLFDETRTDQEPPQSGYTVFEALVINGQFPVFDINIGDEWRQQAEKWRAVEADGRYVAIKIQEAKTGGMHELKLLQTLSDLNPDHPGSSHINSLLDHFTLVGPNGSHNCIVLEILGPSVRDIAYYRRLPSRIARRFAKQSLQALDLLSTNNIAHGDLYAKNIALVIPGLDSLNEDDFIAGLGKIETHAVTRIDGGPLADNVPTQVVRPATFPTRDSLLSCPSIKVIDFGEGFFGDSPPANLNTATSIRPPEMIFDEPVDYRVDLWSGGCLIFELVTGQPPFDIMMGDVCELVRQMLECLGEELPLRWQPRWHEMQNGRVLNNEGWTLQTWLEHIYFNSDRHYAEFTRDEIVAIGGAISRMLRFEPSLRAMPGEILEQDWLQ
ncbi:heterokaryon incompatibility het-6 [Fusarium longipes]|uniref:Heterokaryon incompatibility het-6 n=1 Tax=Fusarium longipes TaxID=694270 RepID=A0A395SXA8_9HYPO|nr:heterokaryon incompatibility het-6 [Fusarium longipes]